jgi:predicted naringenin-chalcone synthase
MKPRPALLGFATAVPDHRYAQMDLYHELMEDIFQNRRAPAIFRATQIETRYSAIEDPHWLAPNPSSSERHARYMAAAPPLGISAIEKALHVAQLEVDDIDEFVVVSCTGVDCPGLDVHIAAQLKMRPTIRRTAIVGMGCHALLPALHHAMLAVESNPNTKVLVLTLELCTLHLQHHNTLPNIIASALFADGASAVVIGVDDSSPNLIDHMVYTDYSRPEEIAFHPSDTGYQIKLSTKIPQILAELLPPLLQRFLGPHHLKISDIQHWLVHPGGIKILEYVEASIGLPIGSFKHPRTVVKNYGNMSSATLLFVLEEHLRHESPVPGDYAVMLGFGPGLTVEFVLLRW